ncbi:MAG: diguanylate cyclase domain-containing protein, partial [Angustibacter sp.]
MRGFVLPDDAARVAALHRLGVLDQPPAPDLDAITRLAAYIAGAPFAAINLVDADRQWQAAVWGGERGEVPREQSMCDVTVSADEVVHVPDARADSRFTQNPFVTGVIDVVRLYCGVPVHDHAGFAVGTLCVTDPSARRLDDGQLAALRDLATQVEQLFELRRQHAQLVDVLAEVDHHARHDPLTGLANRRTLLDHLELALGRGRRSGVMPTLFFCDLDGFKAVNDRYGHDVGDRTIVAVAQRLAAVVREG